MTPAMAAKAAKIVWKGYKQVKKWIEIDQNRRLRLLKDFRLGWFTDGPIKLPSGMITVGVPDYRCADFEITDGVMVAYATGGREPFCDGASLSPDRIGKISLVRAAIGHDAIYAYWEDIARAWGWNAGDVRWLADNMLGNAIEDEAAAQKSPIWRAGGNVIARVAHSLCRLFGGVYHRAMKKEVPND